MKTCFQLLSLILLLSASASGQTSEWYLISNNGGLCSQSIVLFPDGTYNYESGCENSSHFSFGMWKQKKDTILFSQANNKEFTIIRNVVSAKHDDKNLTVKIFDNKGQNITSRILVGEYVNGKGLFSMGLDSTNTKRSGLRRGNGTIILASLQKLFKQRISIPTDSSNYYEITLNLGGDWIYHSNSDWENTGDFKLVKTKEGLMSPSPGIIDLTGIPKRQVYLRQKE